MAPPARNLSQYLINTDAQIHWFSIINSVMIVLFLTGAGARARSLCGRQRLNAQRALPGMVAMIMMRTLHADVRRYNQASRAQRNVNRGVH